MERRSTPGMLPQWKNWTFFPSTTKIGQIRSSTDSVVSRTSRRDQSVLRFRRGRMAGKPWLSTAGVFRGNALDPLFSKRNGLVFGRRPYSCSISHAFPLRGKLAPGVLPGPAHSSIYGFGAANATCSDATRSEPSLAEATRRAPDASSSYRDENGSCAPRRRPGRVSCRNGCRHHHALCARSWILGRLGLFRDRR